MRIHRFGTQLFQRSLGGLEIFQNLPATGARRQMFLYAQRLPPVQIAFHIQRNQRFESLASHNCLRSIFVIFIRALEICDRTVASEEPRIFATSLVESPSRSRKVTAARSLSGSSRSASTTSLRCCSRPNSASLELWTANRA